MRILAVTHGPLVRPELFGDLIEAAGHDLTEWDIRVQGPPPQTGYDAVFIFGGDQNVGEEPTYPWLHEEYDALRRWVADEMPLLGICLGAQTLAYALGAAVDKLSTGPLAGFYETELTLEGVSDPVLGALPARFEALNANGYAFAVPADAVELARSPMPQAFRAGRCAWGVQFHPEIRHEQVMMWFEADRDELQRPLDEIELELLEKLPRWHEHARVLCHAFLAAAARSSSEFS